MCACPYFNPLQALVSEPLKPIFPCVVMSNTVHAYLSPVRQGQALVIGAGTDQYNSLFTGPAACRSSPIRWTPSANS